MTESSDDLPLHWKAGEFVSNKQLYSDPPPSNDESTIQFYGLRGDDARHRLYSIPSNTSVGEVVREFKVGAYGVLSSGYNPRTEAHLISEAIQRVAKCADRIATLIPCRVTFADAAGLKLRFEQQITEDDLQTLEALFPASKIVELGLDGYYTRWDEEGPLFAPVMIENAIHFWWD